MTYLLQNNSNNPIIHVKSILWILTNVNLLSYGIFSLSIMSHEYPPNVVEKERRKGEGDDMNGGGS